MLRTLLVAVVAAGLAQVAPGRIVLTGATTVAGRPIADAVVWIDAPGARQTGKASEAILNQRDVQFAPRVLAVQVGTKVKFPNNDRVFHNVFSYHDGTRFDLGLYPVGAVKEVPFDRPGLSRIFCNIHPQMAAYLMVLDTPFFAVSDREGRFTLTGLPPGTYPYHAWRPGGSIINDEIHTATDVPFVVNWP
jgi:plastocyanin